MATNFLNYNNRHAVAESSLIKATKTGNILNMVSTVDLDNGSLAAKGDRDVEGRYATAIPSAGDEVYLVLNPPLIYETFSAMAQHETNFYNAKGTTLRAYPLAKDDIFTISAEGITALAGEPVVGNLVMIDGTTYKAKEFASGTATTTYGFVGKIVEKVVQSNIVKYRVEVIKNTAV